MALEKARNYCAYQERCQQEVRNRLREWDQEEEVCENIIVELISGNFLNEERFARTFARGKFSIKKWGKQKIKFELKKRNISPFCISKGLQEINEDEYIVTIEESIEKLKKGLSFSRENKYKVAQTLIRRGFEQDLIFEILNSSGNGTEK